MLSCLATAGRRDLKEHLSSCPGTGSHLTSEELLLSAGCVQSWHNQPTARKRGHIKANPSTSGIHGMDCCAGHVQNWQTHPLQQQQMTVVARPATVSDIWYQILLLVIVGKTSRDTCTVQVIRFFTCKAISCCRAGCQEQMCSR